MDVTRHNTNLAFARLDDTWCFYFALAGLDDTWCFYFALAGLDDTWCFYVAFWDRTANNICDDSVK
jgi:hypothetical protein